MMRTITTIRAAAPGLRDHIKPYRALIDGAWRLCWLRAEGLGYRYDYSQDFGSFRTKREALAARRRIYDGEAAHA